MMRGALGLLVVLASACGSGDLCAGISGTCVGLRVASGPPIAQLQIELSSNVMPAVFPGKSQLVITPTTEGEPKAPPITTAIALPAFDGPLVVFVRGMVGNQTVGMATSTITIKSGAHHELVVDFDTGEDLGVADLAGADLSGRDLTVPIDLAGVDMTPSSSRYIFLLPIRGMGLEIPSVLDGYCTAAAKAAGLTAYPQTYRAVIYDRVRNAAPNISTTSSRPILVPTGQTVVANSNLWGAHMIAITEDATGMVPGQACVWTGLHSDGTPNIISSSSMDRTCNGWSAADNSLLATVGDSTASGSTWVDSAPVVCTSSCHLYCIGD